MPRTPRIRRYIFNTLTVVSLLLLLGTVGLWVDSYSGPREIETDAVIAQSERGVCSCGIKRFVDPRNTFIEWHGFGYGERTWFDLRDPEEGIIYAANVVTFPHGFLTVIFAILPAIWLYKWNKRRKLGVNVCPGCGYDLTGNETGKCPECGERTEVRRTPLRYNTHVNNGFFTFLSAIILLAVVSGCVSEQSQVLGSMKRIDRAVLSNDVVMFKKQVTPATLDYLRDHIKEKHIDNALLFMMGRIKYIVPFAVKRVEIVDDSAKATVTDSKGREAKLLFRKVNRYWYLDLADAYAAWIELAKWAAPVRQNTKAATPFLELPMLPGGVPLVTPYSDDKYITDDP